MLRFIVKLSVFVEATSSEVHNVSKKPKAVSFIDRELRSCIPRNRKVGRRYFDERFSKSVSASLVPMECFESSLGLLGKQ